MNAVLMVFLGGGLGSVLRYLIGRFSFHYVSENLVFGTFISNMISCVILSLVVLSLKTKLGLSSESLWLLLGVGFCGGLSTFSTFSYESILLYKSGAFLPALLNVFLSLFFGFAAVFILLSKSN